MGIYLSTPNRQKLVEEGRSADDRFRWLAAGMQGWRVQMEDAHIAVTNLSKSIHVFGVFDGHGGKEVAKFAENHFIAELTASQYFKEGNYEAALKYTFMKIDEMLDTEAGKNELKILKAEEGHDEFGGDNLDSFAGCTANVCLIVGDDVYVANAGDSRACLFRGGRAIELSYDHKPDLEGESNRITKAGGFINDGRINGNLNLSRALGDLEYKRNKKLGPEDQMIIACPDVKRERLSKDDQFILMGCDGIWEAHTPQELLEKVSLRMKRSGATMQSVVEETLDELLAPDTSSGIGCDNMSCILIALQR